MLPSKWLTMETIPHHELSDHSFKERFQFCDDRESSKLGNLYSEEPSQISMETADAAVGRSDQRPANKQLSSAQGTIESVQSMRSDSGSLHRQSPSSESEDGNLSDSTTD